MTKEEQDINSFLKSRNDTFKISGYAGTGKTTFVGKYIKQHPNLNYALCAFTNRAAKVLSDKLPSGVNAKTIHKTIYKATPVGTKTITEKVINADGSFEKDKSGKILTKQVQKTEWEYTLSKDSDGGQADVVFVDEASMVPSYLVRDLFAVCKKVIFIGDEGQLPPVEVGDGVFKYKEYFHGLKSDIHLTVNHRQKDNIGILKLAAYAREVGELKNTNEKDVAVITRKISMNDIIDLWDDFNINQVLCFSNKNRLYLNSQIRKKIFGSDISFQYPLVGETLIANKGDTNGISKNSLYKVMDVDVGLSKVILALKDVDNGSLTNATVDLGSFNGSVSNTQFSFAHAITTHRSQGSEFDRVMFFDDVYWNREPMFKERLYYTAITRAKEFFLGVRG